MEGSAIELAFVRSKLTLTGKNYHFENKFVRKKTYLVQNNKFPSGLFSRIVEELRKSGYTVTASRVPNDTKIGIDSQPLRDVQLRDFQEQAVNIFLKKKQGIIQLPTGSGKTVIASAICGKLQTNCLFLVDREELAKQTLIELERFTGERIGLIDSSKKFRPNRISVGMVRSIKSKLNNPDVKKYLDSVGLLIQDEAHRAGAISGYEVGLACSAQYRLALSATPINDCDVKDSRIQANYGDIIFTVPFKTLSDQGWLAKPHVFMYTTGSPGPLRPYPEIKKERIIECPDRLKKIVKAASWFHAHDLKTLILVDRSEHGFRIEQALKASNIPSAFVWFKTDNRKELVKSFKDNEIRTIVGSSILREGIDIPDIDSVIVAAGEKSHQATLQGVGRGSRKKYNNVFYIVDFNDTFNPYLEDHTQIRLIDYEGIGAEIYPLDSPLFLL
jgi:superfamily II DNA or RNA helicase